MTRWLCISNWSNDKITREKNIWGVARRYQKTIANVRKGDTLLMYTVHEMMDKKMIPSAITSIYEVISDVFEDNKSIFKTPKDLGEEKFPLRLKLEPVKIFEEPILFKPIVPKLKFIKNKTMWSGSIRTAMRMIPEEDYQFILTAGKNNY
jgi:predicted RNA-binding protein